ncbi:MAG: hypothetical protein U0992_22575 [Planctomycetaceae bacterium]
MNLHSSSTAACSRWESIRKHGRRAYIIKFGILGWGIPVSLVLTIWDWYRGLPVSELAVPLALRLVLFGIIGGIAFGACMWKVMELMYGHHGQQPHA